MAVSCEPVEEVGRCALAALAGRRRQAECGARPGTGVESPGEMLEELPFRVCYC
eukprot:COSAG02_NODE_38825_length_424_cov_0.950769_1_plen_53_part_10